jgi:hypothetical protein
MLALGISGCQRNPAQNDSAAALKMGLYRALLVLPAGELPFGLDLKSEGSRSVGYLVNGKERVKLDEVTVAGAHLTIRMPGYENRLTDANGDQLTGEVVLSKSGAKEQHIVLHAERGRDYRFFDKPTEGNADVSGRWSVKFTDDDGKPEAAVGEFSQSGDVVTGTFLAETGDHRFLAGQVRGHDLYLSTFDGAHAFLYKAQLAADGTLAGDYWSGTAYHERWNGQRDANAALPDAYRLTSMRSAGQPMLDHVYAFPTTIFIDRKGMVRKIHTGFSGPATEYHYTQFVEEVKATLDQLLSES